MSKKVKIKAGKISVLSIITLVFAIITAVFLGLAAVWSLLHNGTNLIYDLVVSFLTNGTGFIPRLDIAYLVEAIYTVFWIATVFVTPLLAVAAAILLIVNRRGALVFLPMGILTYTAIQRITYFVLNIFIKRLFMMDAASLRVYEMLTYIFCIAVSAVFAVVIYLISATLLRKLRPIPMALISLILGAGLLLNVALIALTLISNTSAYIDILQHTHILVKISLALDMFVSPVCSILTYLLLYIASITAIVAVLPYKKSSLVQVSLTAEGAADVAKTVVGAVSADESEPVAEESVEAAEESVEAAEEAAEPTAE